MAIAIQPDPDPTRSRLLQAAGEVFADLGYHGATVRDICAKAGANVAAVNYHFRDKMGLYIAVLKHCMGEVPEEDTPDPVLLAAAPQEALRAFITGMLHRMYGAGERDAWHLRIMTHEMAHPTEALPRVVDEIMAPKYAAIRRIVSHLIGLPLDHDTTRLCAHSVIGQVVHYAHARPAIALLWPDLKMTPRRLDQIAAHITDFSLCSLRATARAHGRPPGTKNPKRTQRTSR